jgi:tetratricopeptide (TPR) repeat protein
METILFDNVYPLYGAIDIRNSSTERNKAIQQDMLEQLDMASAIIKKALKETNLPLLGEVKYKIKKYRESIENIAVTEEEIAINQFMKQDVVELFQQLKTIAPSVEDDIAKYFNAITSVVDMVYHHRKEFDESITAINKALAKFIDVEQEAAQKMYPHYFERFVTDGVDFNIYIGQSIAPGIPFTDFYLRNLKIWQLTTLAKAAQLSRQLVKDVSVPMQTTQLLLAHNYPISISFRPAERKFDVDGAYNIRYEIIKKRIDKVHVKDTEDRLTQPDKIAIVYTQAKEGEEYMEYIEYLLAQKVLKGEVEQLELEELQGVVGLKAFRIAVNVDLDEKEASKLKSEAYKG